MNLSAALWEKSASKNQWFNIDSCTIASTKTGAMDYFKHATSSPREGDNVVRAAKYFNKQRRSFEQVSDLSLDIPLPNNKSKYQASGVKSPLNCSLKDFHQEESSKKLFFKEFQQSLTKASVKKQVRDKYFKSQLKD